MGVDDGRLKKQRKRYEFAGTATTHNDLRFAVSQLSGVFFLGRRLPPAYPLDIHFERHSALDLDTLHDARPQAVELFEESVVSLFNVKSVETAVRDRSAAESLIS